jgi:hypothetical protein
VQRRFRRNWKAGKGIAVVEDEVGVRRQHLAFSTQRSALRTDLINGFGRARLQPCRYRPIKMRALAPQGLAPKNSAFLGSAAIYRCGKAFVF